MSTSTVWAWIFAILFIIVGIYAIHEHGVAATATTNAATLQAEMNGAAGGTEAPMIPYTGTTTTQ
jgi:hypothetical protein